MPIDGQDLLQILSALGFPAAVTFWLLMRTDRRLDELNVSLKGLAEALARILAVLEARRD